MRLTSLGFTLLFSFALMGSAESAEGVYRIVSLSEKHATISGMYWRACGDYFAAADSTEGKIIHFNFEKRSAGKSSTVFAFSRIDRVVVSVREGATAPTVAIMGTKRGAQFLIMMNAADYKTGLPCLANGTGI